MRRMEWDRKGGMDLGQIIKTQGLEPFDNIFASRVEKTFFFSFSLFDFLVNGLALALHIYMCACVIP